MPFPLVSARGYPFKNYHFFNILCVFPLLYIHLRDETGLSAQKNKFTYPYDFISHNDHTWRRKDISNSYML